MFVWDSANLEHIAVHQVTREEAEEVILNAAFALDVRIHNGEERTRFLGETKSGRVLVVVVTERGNSLRVVTAFPANKTMRRIYYREKDREDDEIS